MESFEDAINEVKQQFARRRIANFAKKNGVEIDGVEVIDEEDAATLEREFKRNNNIKIRIFKNLSEEQKQAWKLFYSDHAKLSLKVKDGIVKQVHDKKHDAVNEDVENVLEVQPLKERKPKVKKTKKEPTEKPKKEKHVKSVEAEELPIEPKPIAKKPRKPRRHVADGKE